MSSHDAELFPQVPGGRTAQEHAGVVEGKGNGAGEAAPARVTCHAIGDAIGENASAHCADDAARAIHDGGNAAGGPSTIGDTIGDKTAARPLQEVFDRGVAMMARGDRTGAVAAFQLTLSIAPGLPEAHINLGLLLSDGCMADLGSASLAAAEDHYRTALRLDPVRLDGYLHLAVLLAAQKRFDEAEFLYRTALSIDAEHVAALSNLGVLLACTNREQQALACYRAALSIDPEYDNAHFNLAYLLLRDGQFAQGWAAFEHRPWYGRFEAALPFPSWSGQPLTGKNLLMGVEAGNGDMIQFCRYAALAKQAGAARVGILCHPGLTRLLQTMPAIDAVFGIDTPLPTEGWDYWTPPLSMPYRFATRIDTIPASLPYLAATPEWRTALQRRLQSSIHGWQTGVVSQERQGPLRIGLVWQGNRRFENDLERSLPSLVTLGPLSGIPDARFFSLQKGPGELSTLPPDIAHRLFPGIVDLAPAIVDFADTAALIAELDLVITVDTAVGHLAGALGKPCWVLLPVFKTDWRWLRDRDDSPWYPHVMRLFRQTVAGDWSDPIERMRLELMQFS